MRWIWIDRFLDLQHGKSARAVKLLSLAEDHFTDHFPGYPVMPGTLILEGLAQAGGILVGDANDFREKVVLAKIPWARFHREAREADADGDICCAETRRSDANQLAITIGPYRDRDA